MRSTRSVLVGTLVFLFLAEAQRAFFASLVRLSRDALSPAFDPAAALLALAPLAALALPLLPLARWLDRRGAVAVAAAGVSIFRVPATLPHFGMRTVAAALVLACGIAFLAWAVGYIERRALAAGAVLGLVADQLLRLAGTSWDPSLRPGWLPVQLGLSLLLLVLVVAWTRADRPAAEGEPASPGLERRAGGLRLRGALALGALLFVDLQVLGLPPVLSRWTGLGYDAAALLLATAAAVAAALAVADAAGPRLRSVALGLVALLAISVLAGRGGSGPIAAVCMAAGHGAALLLIARSLDPASGRRAPGLASAGLLLFVALTAAHAAAYHHGAGARLVDGPVPWLPVVAVVVVAGCFLLLPHRPSEARSGTRLPGLAAGGAVIASSALLLALVVPDRPPGQRGVVTADGLRSGTTTVVGDYGFDSDRRFDPVALARSVAEAGAGTVVISEMAAGLPSAYGADLPLWLERRLGTPVLFVPTRGRLLGYAVLAGPSFATFHPPRMMTSTDDTILRNHGQPTEPEGGLEKQLRSLEQQAEIALPGFDAQFFNRAGDVCVEAQERSRALAYYGRAIDAYLRAGRYNAAGAVCRKLLRISPGSVRARCTLAWLSIGKGMLSDAQWEVDEYVDAAVAAGQSELAATQLRMMGDATYDTGLRGLLAGHLHKLGDSASADTLLRDDPAGGEPREAAGALWSRVLRAALMDPGDLREDS